MLRTATAIGLASLLLSCVTPKPLPYPAQRIRLGSFSFMPPDEPGWFESVSAAATREIGRPGASEGENYLIRARLLTIGSFANDEDFLARGRERLLAEQKGRFSYRYATIDLWPSLGARCLRESFVFWESEAPETVFTVVAFTCVHPRAPSTGIMLSLSQRCRDGHEDPEVAAKAEAMAATLQFLD